MSFDVPYPADYGGAIDVYYKIKSLWEAGCEIYLHCYEYGRGQAPELEKYCKQVWYYQRNTGIGGLSLTLPYIVSSRKDNDLLKSLQETDAPILFEGVHTTAFLSHPSLRSRYKAIRTHNVEHDYYLQLYKKESSGFKRMYYRREAALLKRYEAGLNDAQAFFSLSMADNAYFRKVYPSAVSAFVAPFHGYDEVKSIPGTGEYCLYHGNLSHPENIEAAVFLLREVFSKIQMPIIIAGKNPANDFSDDLVRACKHAVNCELIANPHESKMEELIRNAHIHVLPTFQQSGMKLKLLNSLFGGRHVIANDAMLYGTGLQTACSIANNKEEFITRINELAQRPFTGQDIEWRKERLKPYDKKDNAKLLLAKINH